LLDKLCSKIYGRKRFLFIYEKIKYITTLVKYLMCKIRALEERLTNNEQLFVKQETQMEIHKIPQEPFKIAINKRMGNVEREMAARGNRFGNAMESLRDYCDQNLSSTKLELKTCFKTLENVSKVNYEKLVKIASESKEEVINQKEIIKDLMIRIQRLEKLEKNSVAIAQMIKKKPGRPKRKQNND